MTEESAKRVVELTPALKQRVITEAERRSQSMNDVIVGAIADQLGMPFEPTGRVSPSEKRHGKPRADGTLTPRGRLQVPLRVPRRINRALKIKLAREDDTGQRFIVAAIEHALNGQ